MTHDLLHRDEVRSCGIHESYWYTHLLDKFAAQRDVGAAEDVGHVSWDTQVILCI